MSCNCSNGWGSSKSWESSWKSTINGSGVDSWGVLDFVGVDDAGWSNNLLDNWFTLNWCWDWYVVWSINMDWSWYFDHLDYVLDDIIWDIVWFLNWDWFVNNKRFLGDAGDWGIVSNGSQKGRWDGNVDVSNDWLEYSGVVCSNVWSGTIFDFLGYYLRWLVNRDCIWARNVGGGVWSWKADCRGGSYGNWSSSYRCGKS
jgi:hypothetical protein